jgi:DNA-binding winged helix-turn-helix (wHTH) protein/Tol biopolymer transport system component
MDAQAKLLYQFGSFQLDADERVLRREGSPVALPPKAFDVLLVLVSQHGHIVEKEALLKAAWPDAFVEEGNLPVNVSLLRKALGDDRQNGNRYIETVPRRGYRFVADVVQIEREATGRAKGANSALPVADTPSLEAPALVPARLARKAVLAAFLGAAVLALAAYAFWPRPQPLPQTFVQITHDGRNKSGPIVTDGTRLYFNETVDGEHRPSEVLVSGGETAAIPTSLHNLFVSDISPDDSELLGAAADAGEAGDQLWAVPLLGGSPRRIGGLRGRDPAWSPDGRRIAYLEGSGLFVAASEGSNAHQLFSLPEGHLFGPRWSPRGDSLRFEVRSNGDHLTSSLWEIAADGKRLRQLLPRSIAPPRDQGGNWTAGGKWFVFASEQNGNRDLWALRERLIPIPGVSSGAIQLTAGPMIFGAPMPSKDGKRVFAIGERQVGELSRYDAAHQAFEPHLSGLSASWVISTRDHEWTGYIKYPDGTLWRMRRDGGDKKQLTFAPTKVSGDAWSPDGTEIAIYSQEPGEPSKVGLIARDGGKIDYVIPGDRDQGAPSWSADGGQLIFGDVPPVFGQDDGSHTIHIFDLRTKQTSDLPGSKGLWSSRWSPDGRNIAALTITSQDLMLFDWTTKRWRDLRAGPVNNPTWSSDSRYIYYDTLPARPDAAIYRVRIQNARLERVASLGGIRRAAAWWSGLAWDDSPLILRDIGSEEIYSVEVNWP